MRVSYLLLSMMACIIVMPATSYANMPANGYVSQDNQALGLIVKMRNETTPMAIAKAGGQARLSAQTVAEMKVIAAADLTYKRAATQGTHIFNFSSKKSVQDAQAIAERLMTMPNVEYATPNLVIKPMLTPNDPEYTNQWALNGSIAGARLPAAWDTSTGSSSVPIAVLDTGYTRHSDLDYSSYATSGYDFISDTAEAGDGGGRDSDARDEGDYCASDSTASSWHGTAVMSIIGAKTNNAALMAGVNWHANMIPVRVLGRCGGTEGDLVDAIRWAAGLHVAGVADNPQPAKVINMSLGSVTNTACDAVLQSAIDDAYNAGVVLIAAAGNSTVLASDTTPANCNHVLAIAAHDESGDIASFSNYGDKVALSAPGVNIDIATCSSSTSYSSSCDNSTVVTTEDGTSFSAPMVSGVASLLFAINSAIDGKYVGLILQNSARSFETNSTCSDKCGKGMLDAEAAVAMLNNFVAPAKQVEISKDKGGAVSPVFWLFLGLLVWINRYVRRRANCDKCKRQTS